MNQVAISTVILRIVGVYVVYDLIAGLAMGAVIQQALYMPFDTGWQRTTFSGWITLGILIRIAFGVALVIYAGRISRILFRVNTSVITEGSINGAALFWVGLCLLGFYFLISYLPMLIEVGFQWFKEEAADSVHYLDKGYQNPYYSPIEPIVMSVLSLFLIFKSRTICSWIDRVAK